MRIPFISAGLCLLFLNLSALGQIPIRNGFTNVDSNPVYLLDGSPGTRWASEVSGAYAEVLTDVELVVEAEFAVAEGDPPSAAYRLMASDNNRDWWVINEGTASTDSQMRSIRMFPATPVRYLKFTSLSEGPVSWELFAGSRAEVEDQVAAFVPPDWGDITDPATIAGMIDLAFDWQIDRMSTRQDGIGWVNGAFFTGVSGLYAATGLPKYRDAIVDFGTAYDWTMRERTSGKAHYHADDHCIGQSWLELYLLEDSPSAVWILDVKSRLDRVMASPLPGRQDMNWCDALYMSPPNYVRMAEITGNDAYRTFIDIQWWDVTDYLYDTEYGLFYRDASYFDDREPNGQPVFWSRGNGWVIGGLVRMLQYIPADWPTYNDYANLLEEMASALAGIQGEEDGLWSSSLLYPEKYDFERETSGSSFFTYAIAWGINEGILDRATYGPVVEEAWAGLATYLAGNGALAYIQQIGAGPARNDGGLLDRDYGYGAFILAGTEMMRYYEVEALGIRQPARRLAAAISDPASGDAGAWSLVEDFEGTFSWTVRKDVLSSERLIADPADPWGSRVFAIHTGNFTPGMYRATVAIPSIPEGQVGTVYQRFNYDSPEIDVLLGISDEPVVDSYGDYENGIRVYFDFNQLEARSGGTYRRIDDQLLQLDTWYEAWMVVDNASDTYDVYMSGGSKYPEPVLIESNIPFRNGTTSGILSYALSYNTDYCDGTFYLDDLYVDNSGINLSRPAPVRQSPTSPWLDVGRNRWSHLKSTTSGEIFDAPYPWIYHKKLNQWCYVWPEGVGSAGLWIWLSVEKTWRWLPRGTEAFLFDPDSGSWMSAS